jgi:cytidylate kinase
MSSLLCIAGPPGAGKSTVSALVSARLSPSVLIRGDAFYRFLDQGAIPAWLPEASDQNRVVIHASGAAAGRFARGGYDAVFDGVLGPWWLPTFFEATELNDLHYAVLLPSANRCVHNVAAREGHVDEPATRHMHDQFQRALADLDTRHVLTDPPGGPEDTATEVLYRYRQGLLVYDGSPN